jgi:Arc/MetJ-type ribon-helix-helix transcriptional regulator
MDRDVVDTIEREIDQEVRARFPGTAVRQAMLLQYGDDPEIEPGALWVRVLLDADGPEDNQERALTVFEQANETAIEQFRGYLTAKLREISLVEYTFTSNPITSDDKGPRAGYPVGGPHLSDVREWEHGEATFVLASLGPASLETVDTLIMAGTAATRAEVIRWALDRIREQQAYQRLRELRGDGGELKNDRDVLDMIEREIDQEVKARFPGTAVRQAMLLQYGDDPEIEPGALWVRVLLDADRPEDYDETLTAFHLANTTAREQFTSYLAEQLPGIRLVEYTFANNPVTFDGHGPRLSNPVGERLPDIQEREHGEATPLLARLGPAGLETLDTLIMAGTAATRAEAIRWALDRIRERPAHQRLRELRSDADKFRNE